MTTHEEILAEFYKRTGLAERWLRQRADERLFPPSKARIDRARSMAKLLYYKLSKDGDSWFLWRERSSSEEGQPFHVIEDTLFEAMELLGVPNWLKRPHSTWQAVRALEAVS